MGVDDGLFFNTRDLHFRIPRRISGSSTNFQFNLTSFNFEGWGMGVVKGFIFGSRDLHFRIPRPISGSGTDFQLNLKTFNFCRGL